VVEASLRHYVSADMHDWHEYLPLVEFALNSAYHEAIQTTPYRMNRITVPSTPFETLLERSQTVSTEVGSFGLPSELGKRSYVQAHEEFQRARRCVHASKCRMKAIHDAKGSTTTCTRQVTWYGSATSTFLYGTVHVVRNYFLDFGVPSASLS
jgi:hypothetical protein